MSEPFSADQVRELRGQFDAILREDRSVTVTTVSRECGYSVWRLSQWRMGKYDSDCLAGAIKLWMDSRPKRRDWISTTIASQMRGIVHLAVNNGLMAAIVAPAGTGKTHTLKALARELNGVYVSVGAATTAKELLFSLAMQLGCRSRFTSRIQAHRFIIEQLVGSKRPVFVDEAQNIGAAIGSLRAIFDESGSTIVLAGAVELVRIIDDRSEGNGQLSSRIVRWNALDAMANEADPGGGRYVGTPLFSMEEIEDFFANREIRLAPDALKLAWQLANLAGFGSLRLIDKAQAVARDLEPGLTVLDRARFVAALRLLHGGDFDLMHRIAQQREPAEACRIAVG